MKAAIIRAFGRPETFEIADMPIPQPGAGQVLVRVHAASVNPVDYKIRQNGAWAHVPMPAILGYDAAGTVAAVGEQVQHLKVGDEVCYSARIFGRQGTYAEYHVEDAEIVVKKPACLTFEAAAALPLAAMTAYDAIISFFQTKPGDTVLVHAGAGGVGSMAVQLAKASGARVLATGRQDNSDLIRSLGADEMIDYRSVAFEGGCQSSDRGLRRRRRLRHGRWQYDQSQHRLCSPVRQARHRCECGGKPGRYATAQSDSFFWFYGTNQGQD